MQQEWADILLILFIAIVVFTADGVREFGRGWLLAMRGGPSFIWRERGWPVLSVLSAAGVMTLCALNFAAFITAQQAVAALAVWIVWLLAGRVCLVNYKED